jgi:hypothetical protein
MLELMDARHITRGAMAAAQRERTRGEGLDSLGGRALGELAPRGHRPVLVAVSRKFGYSERIENRSRPGVLEECRRTRRAR